MTYPPIVEAHREAHQLQRAVRKERDNRDVENFLLGVGVDGQEWVGVLRKVMCTMELPEAVVLVHKAVVPVEPEVQDDTVEAKFDGDPPADGGGCLAGTVGEKDAHQRAEG